MTNDYAIMYRVSGYDSTHTKYLSGEDTDQIQSKFEADDINKLHEVEILEIVQVVEDSDKIIVAK
jgi:hypothetical protein